MRAPSFWQNDGLLPRLLSPIGLIYDAVASSRFRKIPYRRAKLPVICVGNFTAGGAGKTPVVIALGKALMARGETPFVVTKGYGGSARGPLRVNPDLHTADFVGDEPMMIARSLPTIMCKDRAVGAKMALDAGASLIILDDGYQSPDIFKDISLLVVDAEVGVGNGMAIPSGPLRLSLDLQRTRADHTLLLEGASGITHESLERHGISGWHIPLKVDAGGISRQKAYFAFAGIGRPEKFFESAREAGLNIVETRAFPDHHAFTEEDALTLHEALGGGLALLTTAKDAARFKGTEELEALAKELHILKLDVDLPDALIDEIEVQLRVANSALSEAAAST